MTTKPETLPKAVVEAVALWAKRRKLEVPELAWDGMMGCYFFWDHSVFFGVETDGHIHT